MAESNEEFINIASLETDELNKIQNLADRVLGFFDKKDGEQEICRSFRNTGKCRFGEECKFEHSEGEPVPQPPRRARGECFRFEKGECEYGDRCRFNHGPDDTRDDDKTKEVCRNFQRGRCKNGDECLRIHEPAPAGTEVDGENKPRRERRRKPRNEDGDEGDVPRERRQRKPRPKICFAFRDEGVCERGDDCMFVHAAPRADGEEGEGDAPRRRRRKPKSNGPGECFAFRDGNCERGEECRFTHDAAPAPQAE